MSGEKIEQGFRGVVLVAEVLERLGVAFAVYGFQDALIPFKGFGDRLDAVARTRIGEMPAEVLGARRGGHNRPQHNWDGPVLDQAALLMRGRAGTPILMVVSDGEPSGPDDGERHLRHVVRKITEANDVLLVGVGVGPGTDHVARYYPVYLANVPLAELPAALGASIDGLLRR
jgi:cobalamin biosynthesis protein CobT